METYRVRWVIDGNTVQAQTLANTITRIRLAGAIASGTELRSIAPPLDEPLGKTSKKVLRVRLTFWGFPRM